MKIFVETERLILRELLPSDDEGMFELDSDPDVHKYVGDKIVEHIDESRAIIAAIRQQYIDNGIGRWAMIEKDTGNFIGWSGFKFEKQMINNHINYYDVGYRLLKKHWSKGFATESAIALVNYGFQKLNLTDIYARVDMNNLASRHVLEKAGLNHIETYDDEGYAVGWYNVSRNGWHRLGK